VVTFFLPARYRSLSREPSLLSGVVTIVGKVVHVDARPASEASVGAFPRAYFDRETLTTFGPALERADQSLLDLLKLDRDRLIQHVRDSLTISSPVAVIIPLAIYQ
jgi:hypothetical protein